MTALPDRITLYPSRLRLVLMSMAYFVASAVFFFAIPTLGWWGWFFGIVLIIAGLYDLRQLFKKDSFLTLAPDYFEESLYGEKARYQWAEVSEFTLQRGVKGSVHVMAQRIAFMGAVSDDEQLGDPIKIVNPFSISTRKLLKLLNGFRDRALSDDGAHQDQSDGVLPD